MFPQAESLNKPTHFKINALLDWLVIMLAKEGRDENLVSRNVLTGFVGGNHADSFSLTS